MKLSVLSEKAEKKPLVFASLFFLAAVSCIAFLTFGLAGYPRGSYVKAVVRTLFGIAGAALMIICGNGAGLKIHRAALKNFDIVIAAFLIAVNNFPLIALATGKASVTADTNGIAALLFFCFSTGLFEEVFFRGLIFPMLLIRFRDKKHGAVFAALISSAAFSLVHLFNLSSSLPDAVMFQLGYTFLTGMLFAVLYYMTRSIWFPVLCHALYNVGGFLIEYAGTGEIWNTATVILTAVLSVAVFLWLAFRFWRESGKKRH